LFLQSLSVQQVPDRAMAARATRSGAGLAHDRAEAFSRALQQGTADLRFPDSQAATNHTIGSDNFGDSHAVKNLNQEAMVSINEPQTSGPE
jgi:hypothetical protein